MPVTDKIVEVPIAQLVRHHFSSVRRYGVVDSIVDIYAEHLDEMPLGIVWWTGRRWELLDGRHRTSAGVRWRRTHIRYRIFGRHAAHGPWRHTATVVTEAGHVYTGTSEAAAASTSAVRWPCWTPRYSPAGLLRTLPSFSITLVAE